MTKVAFATENEVRFFMLRQEWFLQSPAQLLVNLEGMREEAPGSGANQAGV